MLGKAVSLSKALEESSSLRSFVTVISMSMEGVASVGTHKTIQLGIDRCVLTLQLMVRPSSHKNVVRGVRSTLGLAEIMLHPAEVPISDYQKSCISVVFSKLSATQ